MDRDTGPLSEDLGDRVLVDDPSGFVSFGFLRRPVTQEATLLVAETRRSLEVLLHNRILLVETKTG